MRCGRESGKLSLPYGKTQRHTSFGLQKIPALLMEVRHIWQEKAPTVFPSARTPALRHNEGAPLSTSSQPCNSTALAPRTFVPVHDLPSQDFYPNGGCCPTAESRFGHFLALTVPSAVGFAPSSFYAAPWRILAFTTRSHTTSQNSNYAIPSKFWCFSFAKYRTSRKNPQAQYSCGFADIYFQNSRFWKCLLTF